MRAILMAMVAAVVMACGPSCLPDSQGGGVDWPKVAHCAPGVEDVIGTVERDLLADGVSKDIGQASADELEKLAVKYGPETIACLVDLVVQQWTSPGAAAVPERIAGASRGRAFLASRGVERFERSQ